jgi:hypothetical protein
MRALTISLLTMALTVGAAATASAADPPLRTSKRILDRALVCTTKVTPGKPQPILFATGTGSTGSEGFNLAQPALRRLRRPLCYVEFPAFMTADIQVSAEYLVNAIRLVSRRARKPIAVYGLSQGALLPRWALTYWPSLRRKVTDVVAAAGTQHGTIALGLIDLACSPYAGCAPAVWQQAAGSSLLQALNGRPDETPGRTAWTTVLSTTDEVVQPQTGPNPTSALRGASNIVIQDVCPGRRTTHVETAVDTVAIAALADAITHRGGARRSRLPESLCAKPYAPGVDLQIMAIVLGGAQPLLAQRLQSVPRVLGEPPLRAYAR